MVWGGLHGSVPRRRARGPTQPWLGDPARAAPSRRRGPRWRVGRLAAHVQPGLPGLGASSGPTRIGTAPRDPRARSSPPQRVGARSITGLAPRHHRRRLAVQLLPRRSADGLRARLRRPRPRCRPWSLAARPDADQRPRARRRRPVHLLPVLMTTPAGTGPTSSPRTPPGGRATTRPCPTSWARSGAARPGRRGRPPAAAAERRLRPEDELAPRRPDPTTSPPPTASRTGASARAGPGRGHRHRRARPRRPTRPAGAGRSTPRPGPDPRGGCSWSW